MDLRSLHSSTLDLPPSGVAFCPSHPEYYVVGTYFLHPDTTADPSTDAPKPPQKRTGSLILYQLHAQEVRHVETKVIDSATLDIEWSPQTDEPGDLLSVATSTGSLLFYTFDAAQRTLVPMSSHQIADATTLVLDLAWHPLRVDIIAVTLSDGNVTFCQSHSGSSPWSQDSSVTISQVANHTLEPWTLAFSPDTRIIFSGGDDAVLKSTEIYVSHEHAPAGEETTSTTLWSDRRIHQAGVTAILPLANDLLITGSYDDHIRLISAPPVGRRQVLSELNLGGGVWRLRMLGSSIPSDSSGLADGDDAEQDSNIRDEEYTILASCMHAGSRVVRLSRRSSEDVEPQWEFQVLAKFEEHGSMNYGSDVQPLVDGEDVKGKRTVVSTSFYDKLMCVWQV